MSRPGRVRYRAMEAEFFGKERWHREQSLALSGRGFIIYNKEEFYAGSKFYSPEPG